MMHFEEILDKLPRSVAIEVIYLVSHELTLGTPSPLSANIKSSALSSAGHIQARRKAKRIIKLIEGQKSKKLSEFTSKERSAVTNELDDYLRKYTSHGEDVRRRAIAALKEINSIAI
ncbi:MAG: hypothetical protein HC843_12480 [Sphingomonadales bacterium]|nr:hypothetical protein [Sphingomonadales bacterium]